MRTLPYLAYPAALHNTKIKNAKVIDVWDRAKRIWGQMLSTWGQLMNFLISR